MAKKVNASNSNNNTSMFVEDSDEMVGLEESPVQYNPQSNIPSCSSLQQFRQASFALSQASSMAAVPITPQQQPPPYQTSLHMPAVHQQQVYQQNNQLAASSAEPGSFQSNPQQINSSLYLFNNTPLTTFPESSTHTPMPVNQPTIESPTDSNATSNNKMILIKKFSTESGMNAEWAYK